MWDLTRTIPYVVTDSIAQAIAITRKLELIARLHTTVLFHAFDAVCTIIMTQ